MVVAAAAAAAVQLASTGGNCDERFVRPLPALPPRAQAVYINTIRDVYEAFCIHCFLVLMVRCKGGHALALAAIAAYCVLFARGTRCFTQTLIFAA